jgi:hypothetical protein
VFVPLIHSPWSASTASVFPPALAPTLTRSEFGLNVVLAGTTSVRMTSAAASWSDGATPAVPLRTMIK